MNDWWNDPPDDSTFDDDGEPIESVEIFVAENAPASSTDVRDPRPFCPHGNEWGECDRCDFEGDIAFDAERERRLR